MRVAAVVWLVGALIRVSLELWQAQIWAEREAGTPVEAIIERLGLVSWIHVGNHYLITATVAIAASAWARGRSVVRVGQGLLGLSMLLGAWRMLVLQGQSSLDALEGLHYVDVANNIAFFLGLAALLGPTRAPLWSRGGFVAMASAWLVYVHVLVDPSDPALPQWVASVVPVALAGCWSVGLWRASGHEVDAPVEHGAAVDDPSRLRAADGIALLRMGMVARVLLSIASIAWLVAVREDPASGMVVWLAALGQCALAIVLAAALTGYGSLPDRALERGHLTAVIMCLTIGALLELYAASQASALYEVLARASDGTSLWGMPRLSELEAMQTRVQWIGRFSTVIGIVAAVSLGVSLRQTALWLNDFANGDRAATLVVLTILGGGAGGILLAVAQSGAIRDLGGIAAAMLAALTMAAAILVMWLRLLGSLSRALRREPITAPAGE